MEIDTDILFFFFGMSIKNSEITTEISKYLVESISDDPPNNQHTREPLRDFREFPDIAFKYVDDDGNVPHVGQWDSYTNRLIIEKNLYLMQVTMAMFFTLDLSRDRFLEIKFYELRPDNIRLETKSCRILPLTYRTKYDLT